MGADNVRMVQDFCAAWSRRDVDEIMGYFTDDAVYHNMPLQPVTGTEAIRQVISGILQQTRWTEWEIRNVAVHGNVVLTERVDRFDLGDRRVDLPVAGVFELRDGRISAWRDYFDLATWMKPS